jgi:MFS family permease
VRPRNRGWLVVAALFTLTFALSNPLAAFGVFLPILVQEFGWSRGAISLAFSINLVLGGACGFAIGTLADRYGPRALLAATAALAGAGFALASTTQTLWHFYLFVGLMAGVGMSAFYVLSTSTVAQWFDRARGLATGLVLTGFNLGFVVGSPAAAWLIEHVGWRAAYGILGTSCGAVAGLVALGVRYPSAAEAPRPAAPSTSALRHGGRAGREASLGEALADRRFWYFSASWFLMGLVLTMLSVHVVPHARDRGIDLARAALALTAYGLGSVAGRLVFGVGSDRLGPRPTMVLCFALQAAALVALIAPSASLLPLAMAAYGFGFAGADTVIVRVVPDVFGLRALGAIMGVLSLGWRCGAALGPALTGFAYDLCRSYAIPFGIAPIQTLASLLLVIVAASPRPRA